MRVGYRTGDMTAPQLDMSEALGVELREFTNCVEHRLKPTADGEAGLRVVEILEAATQSLKQRGAAVEVGKAKVAA
jgi:predicted dehydrogenase